MGIKWNNCTKWKLQKATLWERRGTEHWQQNSSINEINKLYFLKLMWFSKNLVKIFVTTYLKSKVELWQAGAFYAVKSTFKMPLTHIHTFMFFKTNRASKSTKQTEFISTVHSSEERPFLGLTMRQHSMRYDSYNSHGDFINKSWVNYF